MAQPFIPQTPHSSHLMLGCIRAIRALERRNDEGCSATQILDSLRGHPHWIDKDYLSANVHELVEDDTFLPRASFAQLKTVLTWCTRGERFCDDHWKEVFKKGYIDSLLRRLAELRKEI